MIHPDTFVGIVALAVSVFMLGSAIFNWDRVYESRTPRWIESHWGRGGARMVLAVIGTILFLVGFYLLSGFAPRTVYLQGSRQSKARLHLRFPIAMSETTTR